MAGEAMIASPAIGFMFPGQGTQRRGMARWIEQTSPAAAEVFDLGSEIVGRDLRRLCFCTADAELRMVENAQIAVFTSNAAAAAALAEQHIEPDFAFGHSVGEINALCTAGVLSLSSGFEVVAKRAALMASVPPGGSMAMVVGLDEARVDSLVVTSRGSTNAADLVEIAIVNNAENVVVSGTRSGIRHFAAEAQRAGAKTVIDLPVAAAFHSQLMADLRLPWRRIVEEVAFAVPRCPVVLNTTGTVAVDPEMMRVAMVDQLTKPVRWFDAVRTAVRIADRVHLIEVGASRFLSSLARAMGRELVTASMSEPRTWDRAWQALGHPSPIAGALP